VEGCRGRCETEGAGTGGVEEKSEGRAEGGSEWRPERRGLVSNIFISFAFFFLLTSWQVPPLHEAQGEVRKGPREPQTVHMYEVRGAQGVV